MRRQLNKLISRRNSAKTPSSSEETNYKHRLNVQSQPTPDPVTNVNYQTAQPSPSSPPQMGRDAAVQGTSTPSTIAPNPALKRALDRHIEKLSDADRTAFMKASSSDTDELLERVRKLDDAHLQHSSFRKYTTRITNFLNIFQISVDGTSVFLQSEKTASIVLGGAKLVIGLALRFVEYFDKVSKMLDDLSKYLAPLARYAEKCNLPNICDALANVYADILRFYSAARKLFVDDTGSAKKHASLTLFLHYQWSPFDAEFGQIKNSLQSHQDILLHAGVSEILVDSTIPSPPLSVGSYIPVLAYSKEREEFYRWLSSNNFELKKAKSLEARHDGTCGWLFGTNECDQWMSSKTSKLLWCYGKPGSGKSILASQVIQHLQDQRRGAGSIVFFAYFTVANLSLDSSGSLILALFKQLCRQLEHTPEWLLRAKREARDPQEYATIDYFLKLTASYSEVFIVIDGLDECPDQGRKSVLDFLNNLRSRQPVFKTFVTSRKKSDIARCFDRKDVFQVSSDSQGTINDVNRLIRQKTQSLRQSQDLLIQSDIVFEKVVSTLTQKADGMFLWVVLQLDHLCSLETDSQIIRALERLPMGLTETYSHILEEINRKDPYQKSLAMACFRWILSATRELSWRELEVALPLADPCPAESYEACLHGPSITFVSSACGNLVHVHDNKGSTWWDGENITFIHSSVFQFFSEGLATSGCTEDPWKILFDKDAMHRQNALDCIKYLCLLIEGGAGHSKNLDTHIASAAFSCYSIHNFDKHLLASNEASRPSSTVFDPVEQLLDRDESFLGALVHTRLMRHSDGWWTGDRFEGPAALEHVLWTTQLHKFMTNRISRQTVGATLRLLAGYGLYDATKYFIRQGFFEKGQNDIDDEDAQGRSALILALIHGHRLVAMLLLHEGAKPEPSPVTENSQTWFERSTPLCVAIMESKYKYKAVLTLLLAGVNVNIPARLSGSLLFPLQLAEQQRDHEVVRLLEEYGADRRKFEVGKLPTTIEGDDMVSGADSG